MIPVLYAANETDFSGGGIGWLTDALYCSVTEERNGAFELTLEYPVGGALYEYLNEDCIIKAKPNDTAAPQLFRIYRTTRPINMRVTYYAEHISYLLGGYPIERIEVENATPQTALRRILGQTIVENEFEAESDIELTSSLSLSMISARAALGGVEGSVLDVYGGEYEFDNFKIKLHANRGRDTGVIVSYGKNLTSFLQEKNISETYAGVLPFARYTVVNEDGSEGGDVTVTIPELTIMSPNAAAAPHKRILIKDFSGSFNAADAITPEALLSKAQAWAASSGYDVPRVNIKVAFQNLWQSPEYAGIAALEKVSLCDTLTVSFDKLGVTAKAKVIKTVYDVIRERYDSIELGDARANFADTVSGFGDDLQTLESKMKDRFRGVGERVAETRRAVEKFREDLANSSGLYSTEQVQPDGSTIYYFHDKPLLDDSATVIKITNTSIGFSSDGGGSYPYIIRYDGDALLNRIYAVGINAEYIKTGRLSVTDDAGGELFAADVGEGKVTVAGWVVTSSHIGSSHEGGSFYIGSAADDSGYWLRAYNAADGGGERTFSVDKNGKLNARGAKIEGNIEVTSGSVDGSLIKEGTVKSDAIASGAITADKIKSGAVTAEKIEADAVTADKIKSGAVTSDKIEAGAITADKIKSGAVTAEKIEADAVTADKIKSGAVTAEKIEAGAVTAEKIKSGAVTAEKIEADAVTADKIKSGAVTSDKIEAGAITADKIGAKEITSEKMSIDNLRSIAAHLGGWHLSETAIYNNYTDGIVLDSNFNSVSCGRLGSTQYVSITNGYLIAYGAYIYGSGQITTSDARHKRCVRDLCDKYRRMLLRLRPVTYRYRRGWDGGSDVRHIGFIAQEVESAMSECGISPDECGAVVHDAAAGYGLRYEEFIPLLVSEVQRLNKRVEALENKQREDK